MKRSARSGVIQVCWGIDRAVDFFILAPGVRDVLQERVRLVHVAQIEHSDAAGEDADDASAWFASLADGAASLRIGHSDVLGATAEGDPCFSLASAVHAARVVIAPCGTVTIRPLAGTVCLHGERIRDPRPLGPEGDLQLGSLRLVISSLGSSSALPESSQPAPALVTELSTAEIIEAVPIVVTERAEVVVAQPVPTTMQAQHTAIAPAPVQWRRRAIAVSVLGLGLVVTGLVATTILRSPPASDVTVDMASGTVAASANQIVPITDPVAVTVADPDPRPAATFTTVPVVPEPTPLPTTAEPVAAVPVPRIRPAVVDGNVRKEAPPVRVSAAPAKLKVEVVTPAMLGESLPVSLAPVSAPPRLSATALLAAAGRALQDGDARAAQNLLTQAQRQSPDNAQVNALQLQLDYILAEVAL